MTDWLANNSGTVTTLGFFASFCHAVKPLPKVSGLAAHRDPGWISVNCCPKRHTPSLSSRRMLSPPPTGAVACTYAMFALYLPIFARLRPAFLKSATSLLMISSLCLLLCLHATLTLPDQDMLL